MYLPQYEKAFGSAYITIDPPNHGFNKYDANHSYTYSQKYLLKEHTGKLRTLNNRDAIKRTVQIAQPNA